MKLKTLLTVIALAGLYLGGLSSCSKSETDKSTAPDSTLTTDSVLHETEIDMDMLSAAKSYAITLDTLNLKLAISASVQWPKKIGNSDLKTFQDSILATCFPDSKGLDVKSAILKYVGDVSVCGLSEYAKPVIKPIDKAYPDSINNYRVDLDARVIEFSPVTVTYQVTEMSYLGGAHPNTNSVVFTYYLEKGKILTITDLIAQNKMEDFKQAVKKQLAEQLNLTPAALDDSFIAEFVISPDIYCADGYIFVHYTPYEILPYSFGTIDVQISPFEYEALLTPLGKQLLLN